MNPQQNYGLSNTLNTCSLNVCRNVPPNLNNSSTSPSNIATNPTSYSLGKIERKILKIFLLGRLYKLFSEIFYKDIYSDKTNATMEYYMLDAKIIQKIIQKIVETGEYTLEGIAYCTHIPFDVVYDASCGINKQLSIAPWIKIVDLYLQLKPEVAQMLFDKFLEMKERNQSVLSLLLNENDHVK